MKSPTRKEIITRIDHYLYDPRLEPEALLRKRWAWLWMVFTFIGVLLTTISSLVLWIAWPMAWGGYAFLFCYLLWFPIYRRAKRFDLVINILFSIFIVIMFFVLVQIGGFPSSLGYVFVGLNCAMGSVLAGNMRWTIGMFILYIVTIILIGIFQPYLVTPDYITPTYIRIGTVFSITWITTCIFLLMMLFMRDQRRFEKAETDRIKRLNEAKTLLYTNISHEFRTPLTVIQGIADQIDQHPEKWLAKGPGKIKAQSQVLLRLVNQMLDISKIEAEGMQLKMIHGDISKYVQYVIGSFHSLAENKNIHLQAGFNDEPVYTDFDPEKLMQVLANLLSNAVKFTPSGGNINVEVASYTENNQDMVRINVRDSGRGIPQEDIGRIFERFYQVPDKDDQTPGTGLGLTLTHELVKLMKGRIHVKSELGSGTEFVVTLPVTRDAKVEEDHGISLIHPGTIHSLIPLHEEVKDHDILPAFSSDKPVLLIVEDNKDVVEYLVTILEDYYTIELASNGRAGLKKALDIIPDIILTDIMMPQMDGFEMLSHLKNDILTDHIPVVVLTARGDFPSKLTGLETGADHYLVKPFSEKELFLKLNNLLEARRKMQHKLGILPPVDLKGNSQYQQEVQFMLRINALLEENLPDEDFGIKDICSSLHMSRPQLYRKFAALTDKSIGRHIRSYRLHKAKVLIEQQGKNVTEAALGTGFKNLSHFSASFREEFGYPPSELL
jgi:signal transduction histidine kinase/DNA-binding response OmpR family regulator